MKIVPLIATCLWLGVMVFVLTTSNQRLATWFTIRPAQFDPPGFEFGYDKNNDVIYWNYRNEFGPVINARTGDGPARIHLPFLRTS